MSKMSSIWTTFLILSSVSTMLCAPNCKCHKPEPNESTHWVGNQYIIIRKPGAYKAMRGVIVTPNGGSLEDALVEVFTRPEYLLASSGVNSHGRDRQRRVAACKTGTDGKFCFLGLPPGKYELRASSDDTRTGWNVSHVYVVLNPHSRRSQREEIRVEMTLGI
jgi:hypothetical protein